MTGPERDLRTEIAHPARVYDYWLGGKDNFEVDRAASAAALSLTPEYLDYAVANRHFLVRATRFLAGQAWHKAVPRYRYRLPDQPERT